jgi:hypothetical protein
MMANVSKYATANVDREIYLQFKKVCVNEDVHILSVLNSLMNQFIDGSIRVVREPVESVTEEHA